MSLFTPSRRRWLTVVVGVTGLAGAAVGRTLFVPSAPTTVVINEVMSSNGNVVSDDDANYEDWVELYNPTSQPIALGGYTLTDRPARTRAFVFPDIVIEPESHLPVWASAKRYWYRPDRSPADSIQLGFLSAGWADGETVELRLDGANVAGQDTGLHLAVVDERGTLVATDVFATHERIDESARLIDTLEATPPGQVVMLAIKGDGAAALTSEAVDYLREQLDSEFAHRLDPDDSWGLIAVVGGALLAEAYDVPGAGPVEAETRSSTALHTPFRLRRTGDFVGLYAPDGSAVDTIALTELARNHSWGRHRDGSLDWCHYEAPTPGEPNAPFCTPPADAPVTTASGYYEEPIEVSFGNSRVSEVRLTRDGSAPTQANELYTGPITLEATTVLRARRYRAGFNPSDIVSHTYFIDNADLDISLPVVSLITDPDHLWDDTIGIYVEGTDPDDPNYEQRGMAWERPVTIEFYEEDGTLEFTAQAGIRILGNTSREFPKKSFVLYFRPQYGQGALVYPLFDATDRTRFDSLVLRMGGDDGVQDLPRMRDAVMHTLFAEAGGYGSATRPVFLYLNGAPWGIYNLRERVDTGYIAAHFGDTDVDLIREDDDVRAGDLAHWDETLAFWETADLDRPADLAEARRRVDLENFIDYYLFQTYAGNIDLVSANLIKFRPRTGDGRWRWLMWDVDVSFGLASRSPVTHDTLAWYSRDGARPDLGFDNDDGADNLWATLMLRRLLDADATRPLVLNRLAQLLDTTLSTESVVEIIDDYAAQLDDDIAYDLEVWSHEWDGTYDIWLEEVDALRDFARERPDVLRNHVRTRFGAQ